MRCLIVGGSAGGLMTGLLFARAGHEVLVLDRDPLPHTGEPGADTPEVRPGAPHLVQAHVGTPVLRHLLIEHLPDLYAALLERGVKEQSIIDALPEEVDRSPQPGDAELVRLLFRRVAFELALRDIAAGQPGLEIRTRVRVTGLSTRGRTPVLVTGVRTDAGAVEADLVIDATGRRTRIDSWLAAVGAPKTTVEFGECHRSYYTRHYRVRDGASAPSLAAGLGLAGVSDSFLAMLLPGEEKQVQLGFATLAADVPLRALRDTGPFERLARQIPTFAPWLEAAEPFSPVFAMGGLHNTFRRLVVEDRVVAHGLLAVGDAVCTTNPTFGRGLALTLRGAVDLLTAVEGHATDPDALVREVDRCAVERIRPWFRHQVEVDAEDLRTRRAAVRGEPPPPPPPPRPDEISSRELFQAGQARPDLLRLLVRVSSGLVSPPQVLRDPAVVHEVRRTLQEHPPTPPAEKLPRQALLDLLATA